MRKSSSAEAIFFFFILFFVEETACFVKPHKLFYQFQTKLQDKILSPNNAPVSAPMPIQNTPKSSGRVFYPIGYGADPSGEEDSSDAILNAVADALLVENGGHQLLPGVSDLGGVIIDLQGVSFKISKPIRLPPGAGNLVIQGGTFRASDTFPGDRHLVELWSPTSPKPDKNYTPQDKFLDEKDQSNGIYYEDILFRISSSIPVIEEEDYSSSIQLESHTRLLLPPLHNRRNSNPKGHETFISTCFLGEHPTVGGDRGEKDFSGTAIDLASNDNAVTDIAIFSAATGITLRGQANMITGVHCYNKATYFGGIGILVKAGQTRIDNCYLDYNSIIIEDPSQVHVTNGFFLGGGNIVLKSINGRISGLTIVNNMFSGDAKKWVPTISLDGKFTSTDQVVIDHNNVDGMRLKSTVGKLAVPGNGTRWVADFSSVLVFPNQINHVQYSFYVQGIAGDFFRHVLTNVSNNIVVVESERAVNGVVSVVVDQHNMVGERNFFM